MGEEHIDVARLRSDVDASEPDWIRTSLANHIQLISFLWWTLIGLGALFSSFILMRFVPRIRVFVFGSSKFLQVISTKKDFLEGQLSETLRREGQQHLDVCVEKDFRNNVVVIVDEDLMESTKMIRDALMANNMINLVIVDIHQTPDELDTEFAEGDTDVSFAFCVDKSRHLYYKRLVQSLKQEYVDARVRLATVESVLVGDKAATDELIEFVTAEATDDVMRLTRDEMVRPKVYRLHLILVSLALLFAMAFSLPGISVMDPVTLKPHKGFNPTLKTIARVTNIPIKLGIVHGVLYMMEYIIDPELFKRHVGQRLTTLWYQLIQFPRFGQHLQMHVETLVQAADALYSKKMFGNLLVRAVLWTVITGILVQDALTSLAYHSFTEQVVGFGLGIVKLLCFDWAARGSRINKAVGESLARGIQWIGGALSLSGGLLLNDFAPLHPTLMATLLCIGGAATLLLLMRFKGIPLRRYAEM